MTGPNITSVKVVLQDVTDNRVLNTQFAQKETSHYGAQFLANKDYPRELQLVVTAENEGQRIPVVAHLQYLQPSAEIIKFDSPYPDNADMIIPVIIDVIESGKYRLRGNLYNAELPLAHLVSEAWLPTGNQIINLKAHWSVFTPEHTKLKLTNFVLERMSPSPSEPALFGTSKVTSIDIKHFAHESLNKLPYEPTLQEQQSLQFLHQLSQPQN